MYAVSLRVRLVGPTEVQRKWGGGGTITVGVVCVLHFEIKAKRVGILPLKCEARGVWNFALPNCYRQLAGPAVLFRIGRT